jgi:hypothetical protein
MKESPGSEIRSASPLGIPSPPINLEVVAGDGFILLEWEPPQSGGFFEITGFEVICWTKTDMPPVLISASGAFYNDTDVVNGQQYSYGIRCISDMGASPFLNTTDIMPLGPPRAPVMVSLDFEDGSITLVWDQPESNGGSTITIFTVYRMEEGGSEYHTIDIGFKNGQLQYIDSEIDDGREYTYFVTASNSIGESDPSNEMKCDIPKETVDETDVGLWIGISLTVVVVMVLLIIVLRFMAARRRSGGVRDERIFDNHTEPDPPYQYESSTMFVDASNQRNEEM